jgi:hypothetical protein
MAARSATYTFKHALVQDAAYDSLLKSKRAELHARIGHVLETDFSDQVTNAPELLAYHFTRAGNLVTAIPLWREAGMLALRRVALQEAVGHFQKGLTLIEQQPPSPERDSLELWIREALNVGFAAPEVSVNATSILQLVPGKPQSLLIALYGLWMNTITQGRIADSLPWAQRLLAEGNKVQDIDLQIYGHFTTLNSYVFHGPAWIATITSALLGVFCRMPSPFRSLAEAISASGAANCTQYSSDPTTTLSLGAKPPDA